MKSFQDHEETGHSEISHLVHRDTLTAYERLNDAAALSRAVFTLDRESVLIRNSFRWKKDGEEILDAQSSMSLEQVCERQGWRIVERYGDHLAIVTPD